MTSEVVRVTSKGQATIPSALREKYGIRAPGLVTFVEEGGKLVVKPLATPDEMFGVAREAFEGTEGSRMLLTERAKDKRREERKFR